MAKLAPETSKRPKKRGALGKPKLIGSEVVGEDGQKLDTQEYSNPVTRLGMGTDNTFRVLPLEGLNASGVYTPPQEYDGTEYMGGDVDIPGGINDYYSIGRPDKAPVEFGEVVAIGKAGMNNQTVSHEFMHRGFNTIRDNYTEDDLAKEVGPDSASIIMNEGYEHFLVQAILEKESGKSKNDYMTDAGLTDESKALVRKAAEDAYKVANKQAEKSGYYVEKPHGPPGKTPEEPGWLGSIAKAIGFAKGGDVKAQMDDMMEMEVDPVSGNEVPPGAKPEEVRDDIDAKLSEGEYVVPADVVRYFGVHFFEKLRNKAKQGMVEMEAGGRIGGEPIEEEDDLPFAMEELELEDDAEEGQMEEAGFATGGFVAGASPAESPAGYGAGFSVFGGPPAATGTANTNATTTKTYVNAAGKQVVIQFDATGKPLTSIPVGYYELGTVPPPATVAAKPVDRPEGAGAREVGATSGGSANTGFRSQDFGSMSSEAAVSAAKDRLSGAEKAGKVGTAIGGVAGAVTGIGALGAGLGKAVGVGTRVSDALGVANAREAVGDTAGANSIRAAVKEYTDTLPAGMRATLGATAQGNWGKTAKTSTTPTKEKGSGTSSLAPTTSPRPQARPAGLVTKSASPSAAKGSGSGGAQSGKGSSSSGSNSGRTESRR